jgi:hypothetical protein
MWCSGFLSKDKLDAELNGPNRTIAYSRVIVAGPEQRPVQRAGVDGLEAAFPPRAELPDGPGDVFLARGDRWNPMVLAQF